MKKMTMTLCVLAIAATLPLRAALAEDDDGQPKKPLPKWEYVDLKPLTLPVITDSGLTQQVSLLVTLQVPYGKSDDVKQAMPELADAYITDLYGTLSTGSAMMKNGLVNMSAVKDHLTEDTTKVLGPNKVTNIKIQAMQQSRRQ